ncbi:MAG: 3-phosphoserine/phosphohydroxythreonine transaminase [Coriobacteriia bacterium]|nr:3-phosphoserine/phosphohydroxythreonine transaminase [Coriobacteriia bacterium]MBS5478127.1 3-phosphoserine/phosphohydroxythreonine transaminase [Coriobacteriia bacterium]
MRIVNFNAGPAALPESVLRTAASEMLDYHGCGMSVMEMSHRSAAFKDIIETAEADLRVLAGIPDTYRVLFMQGGGTGQFAAVPLNLMRHGVADYIVSGRWALKAQEEAAKYGEARIVATSKDTGYDRIPDCASLTLDTGADYVYLCQNETVNGTAFRELPDTGGTPLVADVSSCLLSEPMDVTRYGLFYGGVQKNVGPAGVVIVVVRDDLVTEPLPICPTVLSYQVAAKNGSLYNTPPCWNIYVCGLVFKWLREQGGLEEIGARNHEKAALLYDRLDASALFHGTAQRGSRSFMNVTFTTGNAELDAAFVAGAAQQGMTGLKGHRSVGGMRASLYNAVALDGVRQLVSYMDAFEKEHAGESQHENPSCSSSSQSI